MTPSEEWTRIQDYLDQTSQADADQMVAEARVEFLTAPTEPDRWPEKLLLMSVHYWRSTRGTPRVPSEEIMGEVASGLMRALAKVKRER